MEKKYFIGSCIFVVMMFFVMNSCYGGTTKGNFSVSQGESVNVSYTCDHDKTRCWAYKHSSIGFMERHLIQNIEEAETWMGCEVDVEDVIMSGESYLGVLVTCKENEK